MIITYARAGSGCASASGQRRTVIGSGESAMTMHDELPRWLPRGISQRQKQTGVIRLLWVILYLDPAPRELQQSDLFFITFASCITAITTTSKTTKRPCSPRSHLMPLQHSSSSQRSATRRVKAQHPSRTRANIIGPVDRMSCQVQSAST